MKNILLYTVIVFALALSSCNKKYSCKCMTTLTQDGYYPKKTETIKELPKNITKKKGTQICDNTAKQMQANTDLIWPDYVNVGTKCELKDY